MSQVTEEQVLSVHHWNETLFSFTTTRPASLRFKSGHFLMLGLEVAGRPLLRAYSVASPNYEEHLEFYSIKVPDGPLTSRLQHLQPGDPVLVGRKATGTLVLDHLVPGRRLYLLGTGTGLAPFMSIIRDPEVYERFEHVVIAHGVRRVSELGYSEYIQRDLPECELVGEQVRQQLLYYPTVTREPFRNTGRLTHLLGEGLLPSALGLPALDPAHDRIMICGSASLNRDLVALLEPLGFREASHREPGHYAVERAFVEQ
jgi:ferredoxin/flavodoxin---NADP+ reductase